MKNHILPSFTVIRDASIQVGVYFNQQKDYKGYNIWVMFALLWSDRFGKQPAELISNNHLTYTNRSGFTYGFP